MEFDPIRMHVTRTSTAQPMAQLVDYWTTLWEVTGSNPSQTTTQGLKITGEKVLPLQLHQQMFRLSSLLG